jgi:transposase-like protein
MDISILESKIKSLPIDEQSLIYNQLLSLVSDLSIDISAIQINQKSTESCHCPHCKSSNTKKIGFQYNIQRYCCKECGRNYRDTTGTFNAGMRKGKGEHMKVYMKHFLAGKSLRECAKQAEISLPTSFKWRHRILAALESSQNQILLKGIIESDDMFFTYSQKGQRNLDREPRKRGKGMFEPKKRGISDDKVAVIVSQDRKGSKHLKVATRGRISTEDLEKVLKDKIAPESILCSDSHHSYIGFANKNSIEHKTIKASAKELVKENKYHVQHVNQTGSELKKWMEQFNGVSTKYLQQYLNWFAIKKQIENATNPLKLLILTICTSYEVIEIIKNIPNLKYI